MSALRGSAVAVAAALTVALAGCGLGPGESADGVALRVTDDFGRTAVAVPDPVKQEGADTVMRMLQRNVRIGTRYGGGFVQTIDGLSGGTEGGNLVDWFYYLNGVLAEHGAAELRVADGMRVWWDRHRWDVGRVEAVVGDYPQPMLSGADGRQAGALLDCRGAADVCESARQRLVDAGVTVTAGKAGDQDSTQTRVVVGRWAEIRDAAPEVARLAQGPEHSGVFVQVDRRSGALAPTDAGGAVDAIRPGAGLIAAMRHGGGRSAVWVVTGADDAAVSRAVGALDEATLRGRIAAIVPEAGELASLPLTKAGGRQ